MKFEVAYFRSLYFADPPREKAEAIYAKYHSGGVPSEDEYRTFQDYIFRVLIDQAGKLKLPVHFHSAVGIGDYFSLPTAIPLISKTSSAIPATKKPISSYPRWLSPYPGNDLAHRRQKRLHRFFAHGLLRLSFRAKKHFEAMDLPLSRKNHVRLRRLSL